MATNKQIYRSQMNSLGASIISKAGATGKHTVEELNDLMDDIIPGGTPNLQNKTANPSTSSQTIQADSGYDGLDRVTVNPVTSAIDANIVAGNIKKNVTILGVVGTLETGSSPTGTKNITTTALTDVSGYQYAQIVDANLKASNIANGITILGVTGTHSGGITPSGTINITNLNPVNVTNYATAQIVDSNLVPANIANGVTILGITGTHSGGITPSGNINITSTSAVDVTNYATAIVVDSNLVAANIRNGVSILGITGTADTVSVVVNSDNSIDIYT